MAIDNHKGLTLMEWAAMAYALFTTIFIFCFWGDFPHPQAMLLMRAKAVAVTLAMWGVYAWKPGRWTMMLRVIAQLVMLDWWYPDTYELNRVFPNLDHLFASWEQAVFGCQPSLLLCRQYAQPVVSELMAMGYVSYYPLFAGILVYYALKRPRQFSQASFIVVGSFFVFYLIFMFLPVAGPQFYFKAVGVDQIAQGIFPDVGNYFGQLQFDVRNRDLSLPIPGGEDGLWHRILVMVHDAGERPTAAFPSSHVGVTTVVMWLAWQSRNRWLFWAFMPFALLLFVSTFYIQAHYVIDAVAGIVAGTAVYFLLRWLYGRAEGRGLDNLTESAENFK